MMAHLRYHATLAVVVFGVVCIAFTLLDLI